MEAKVTVRGYTSDATPVDSLAHDPIDLPRVLLPGGVVLVPVDYAPLTRLLLALADEEAERQIVTFNLVWSETGESVKAACANCGNIAEVAEDMYPGDNDLLICHNCL